MALQFEKELPLASQALLKKEKCWQRLPGNGPVRSQPATSRMKNGWEGCWRVDHDEGTVPVIGFWESVNWDKGSAVRKLGMGPPILLLGT